MKLKYIIDQLDGFMIFAPYVNHDDAARQLSKLGGEIVGAGFCDLVDGVIQCWGESNSLRIKSRGIIDAKIIAERTGIKFRINYPRHIIPN